MAEGLLALLANRSNQAILGLLAVEPAYPRKVGQLLSLSETEVSRRLKRMEELGVVVGEWAHLGKNVKLYRLAARGARVAFEGGGVVVQLDTHGPDSPAAVVISALEMDIPLPEGFIGRAGELAVLEGPAHVVIIAGLPGIGKTSLLAHYAARRPRGSVFWHTFTGVESLRWIANRLAVFHAQSGNRSFLDALARDLDPADLHAAVLKALDTPGFVHILDDVHRSEDDAVRRLLSDAVSRTRTGRLVLGARETPRHDPTQPHVAVLVLSGLDDADVAAFLRAKGLRADPALLPRIRDEVGGHPLALNLLVEAARERGVPLETLLDKIPEKEIEEYLLREVYEGLSPEERSVLPHASLFRATFTLDDLSAISPKDPEHTLLRLRRRLLVSASEEGYRLHEILRNFFYHHLQDRPRLHEKLAAYLLDSESLANRLEAMHHLLAAGRRERVLDLLEDDLDLRAFDFLDAGHHILYRGILDSFARSEVRDAKRWAVLEDDRGDIAFHRGDYPAALKHYAEAAKPLDAKRDAERLGDLAWKRGLSLSKLGRADEAKAACRAGLAAAPGDGLSRGRLAQLAAELGA